MRGRGWNKRERMAEICQNCVLNISSKTLYKNTTVLAKGMGFEDYTISPSGL